MGMVASYIRISTDFLSNLKWHPNEIADIVFENEQLEEREFDIDKAWHGIYYLLTGTADLEQPIESIVGLAIFGGTEIGEEMEYGPIRYLEAGEVKEIAAALDLISINDFSSGYNVKEMNKVNIYPLDGQWLEGHKEYLVENFKSLVQFFRIAATENEAMLLIFS